MEAIKNIDQMSASEIEEYLAKKKQDEWESEQKKHKDFEDEGDLLIDSIVDEHHIIKADLKAFKDMKTEAVVNYNKKAYDINGKEFKPSKTFKITHSGGKRKVVIEEKDKFDFNSEAIVHINAIKDIIKEKFQDNADLFDFVDSILVKNNNGDYDPKLLAKAKNKARKLNDMILMQEFEKLQNCQIVVGVSRYIRAYEKDENGKFRDISINYSSL